MLSVDVLSTLVAPSRQVVDGFMSKMKKKAETGDTTAGLVDQLNLEEFASVLDNAPPGTDELVALSKASETGKRRKCHRVVDASPFLFLFFFRKTSAVCIRPACESRVSGARTVVL